MLDNIIAKQVQQGGGVGDDDRWMGGALSLATRAIGRTRPNPPVGCVIVNDGRVVGRGWTQPGGRPHAEAMALAQAGAAAKGATVYVTLEPCAHRSPRGPACADLLVAAGPARVVIAADDPDPRTDGWGMARLRDAGIAVSSGVRGREAEAQMAGFLTRLRRGRPHVSLKLAVSGDGCIARRPGEDRWITGDTARAHGHLLRAQADMILIGRGTLEADAPRLDVRLPGMADRGPVRALLSRRDAPENWLTVPNPEAIDALSDIDAILVEGGAKAAAAFLAADRVDRLYLYTAPITVGVGVDVLAALGLPDPAWRLTETRQLGADRLDVYDRGR